VPRGRTTHGLAHAAQAIERGAVAVLWEPGPGIEPPALPAHVSVCGVPELSARLGELADRYFRAPSSDVKVAGITGTNGKTTTAFLLAQASELVGRRSSYLGTIGFGRAFGLSDVGLTTPDAVSVHRRIAQARDDDAKTMAIEVSSHALDQGRVNGVRFDTAVFTNLTRDHLDYHGTAEAYGAAKARLFDTPDLARAVINVGDEFGRTLAARLPEGLERILYTTRSDIDAGSATGWLRLSDLEATASGLMLQVESSWGPACCARSSSGSSTPRTCSRCSACCSAGACHCNRRSSRSRPALRRPGAWKFSAAVRGRSCWSTTRTRRTRSRRCSTRRERRARGRLYWRLRLRRRPRRRQATADGRTRRAARRRRRDHE
jgi:UDP-N-acetylmuramyl-tripeptide synthetase